MKKVNFEPKLEKKKVKIMEEFHRNNGPEQSVSIERLDHSDEAEPMDEESLKARIIEALKTVYDPEIPVNIYDLGLIYGIDLHGTFVHVDMTLTAPGCPVAHTFPGMVERSVELVPGVSGAAVELVWDPPWTPDLISEAARLELGLI